MNQAASSPSAPGTSLVPDSTGLFTTVHLLWIAVFAVIVVAAIAWGIRLKHARKAGEREIARHNADLQQADDDAPAPPAEKPDATAPGPSPAPSEVRSDGLSVTQLKGLGPKVAQRLAELGVTTVGQIAALTDDEAAALDAKLGSFSGRMARDRWQEQARFLAAGDKAGFEAVFGRL